MKDRMTEGLRRMGGGGWEAAKAARESFDISTRIPTRDVCVELAADDVCQRASPLPSFLSLSLSHSSRVFLREITDASNGKMKYFPQTAGSLQSFRHRENAKSAAKSDTRSSAKLKSNSTRSDRNFFDFQIVEPRCANWTFFFLGFLIYHRFGFLRFKMSKISA